MMENEKKRGPVSLASKKKRKEERSKAPNSWGEKGLDTIM